MIKLNQIRPLKKSFLIHTTNFNNTSNSFHASSTITRSSFSSAFLRDLLARS